MHKDTASRTKRGSCLLPLPRRSVGDGSQCEGHHHGHSYAHDIDNHIESTMGRKKVITFRIFQQDTDFVTQRMEIHGVL